MTTVETGRRAEAAAAKYVQDRGFRVLQQNWRTRYCEIDIVAAKGQTIYFIEVKYRAGRQQGTGLDYITPQKLRQMAFAAELWVAKHRWRGEYELAAVGVGTAAFTVHNFVTDL